MANEHQHKPYFEVMGECERVWFNVPLETSLSRQSIALVLTSKQQQRENKLNAKTNPST